MNKFFFNSDIAVSIENNRRDNAGETIVSQNGGIKKGSGITVTGGTAHHIIRVLRMRQGEDAVFCDGACTDYYCVLDSFDLKTSSVSFSVQEERKNGSELPFNITVYQGLPSSEKLTLAIQKTVELGVNKIIPVHTRYSHRGNINVPRLNKISEMAAAQSKRGIIPCVESPITFDEIISAQKKEPVWLAAYENEKSLSIRQAVKDCPPCETGIWIGPEGGFSEDEIISLQKAGADIVSLGKRILRTETAGMAAMVQLQCAWNAEVL